jgi:hypothetical protein
VAKWQHCGAAWRYRDARRGLQHRCAVQVCAPEYHFEESESSIVNRITSGTFTGDDHGCMNAKITAAISATYGNNHMARDRR